MRKHPKILKISLFDDSSLDTGAAKTITKGWTGMSDYATILSVRQGLKETLRKISPSYHELTLKAPKPSLNKWLRVFSNSLFGNFSPLLLLNLDSLIYCLLAFLRLQEEIHQYDKIVTYQFWFALLSSFFPSIRRKAIFNENGGEWIEIAQNRANFFVKFRYGILGRWVLNRIKVIAQSDLNKKFMCLSGVQPNRVSVVRYGRVDSSIFHPTKPKSGGTTFRVLFVGRIVPQKGVHVLVEAADMLVNKLKNTGILFTVVGLPGGFGYQGATEYFSRIKDAVKLANLEPYFNFKFFIEEATLVDLYSESNVFVLPSLQDAFPWVVVEAMMCGTPVIGTMSGGMVEMITDGKTGLLVPPGNSSALAAAISSLAKDYTKALEFGNSARTRAEAAFSFAGFSKDLFEAITSNPTGSA